MKKAIALLCGAVLWMAWALPAAAQSQGPTIIITDSGYNPPTLTVGLGQTVTWINQGNAVHTVTIDSGQTPSFDSGGVDKGQSYKFNFSQAGSYTYHSQTEQILTLDGAGNTIVSFALKGAVIVSAGAAPVAAPAAAAPIAAAPTATPVPAPQFPNATVIINDSGYNPPTLTVGVGQTVTFINQGSTVHTVVTDSGTTPTFDSGGLDKGQKYDVNFTVPNTYPYHSSTEQILTVDGAGNTIVSFALKGTIIVSATAVAPPAPVPAAPVAAPAPVAQQGPCTFVLGFATLAQAMPQQVGTCTDSQAFAPNGDALQHTTGGLLVWRKADNWTAFTDGYRTWINGPFGIQQRLNTTTFPWEPANAPPPAAPVAAPAASGPVTIPTPAQALPPAPPTPTVTPQPTAVPPTTILIDDTSGFNPSALTVKVGQTVTWVNRGQNVHSVVSNQGTNPSFDSGGVDKGQSFKFTFSQPGSYPYHSSIEQGTTLDSGGNTIIVFTFNGQITVQ